MYFRNDEFQCCATVLFLEWLQLVTEVLSQGNSCTQAHLDMLELVFT
jgi:hypothetical protein